MATNSGVTPPLVFLMLTKRNGTCGKIRPNQGDSDRYKAVRAEGNTSIEVGQTRAAMRKLYYLISLQAALIAIILFVPFGLDQASAWGLDYGHLLLVLALYLVTLSIGLIDAIVEGKWTYVMLQITPVVVTLLAYLIRPLM